MLHFHGNETSLSFEHESGNVLSVEVSSSHKRLISEDALYMTSVYSPFM